jgi:hypothetical protein
MMCESIGSIDRNTCCFFQSSIQSAGKGYDEVSYRAAAV